MVKFSFKEWLIGGKTFCFCFPTRLGIIVMSFLTMILSLLLAVILWFEVHTSTTMSATTRTAFILAALFSTLLLIVSIMGFAGTIAKKLVFVRIYAYFLYFHFVLNIAIAIYLMYQIVHAANTDVVAACERVTTEGTKAQCSGLFKIAKQVYFAVAGGLLIAELYGVLIITRYMRQLKHEKIFKKEVRNSKFALLQQRHSRMQSGTEDIALLNASAKPTPAADGDNFNPYEHLQYRDQPSGHGLEEVHMPVADVEEGYGGGSWRVSAIQAEEKERLARGATISDRSVYSQDSIATTRAVPATDAASHPPVATAGSRPAVRPPPLFEGVPSHSGAAEPSRRDDIL